MVRIRPDIRLMQDINPLFQLLETTNKQIIMEHEQLCILTAEFEDIFKLVEQYGLHNREIGVDRHIFAHFIKQESDMNIEHACRFCPEKNFMEHIDFIVNEKGLCLRDVFVGISYSSYNLLYRGGGSYGHVNYDENTWKPYHSLEDIKKM